MSESGVKTRKATSQRPGARGEPEKAYCSWSEPSGRTSTAVGWAQS